MRAGLILTAFLLAIPAFGMADTLHVPGTYPTIQDAVNAAVNGDTVVVAPGTYVEEIDFIGKAITVTSSQGPESTVVDGDYSGRTVVFTTGEGTDSVINGFTLTRGLASHKGGAVFCEGTSPTISNNIITQCRSGYGSVSAYGGGIYVVDGSPVITNNLISQNLALGGNDGYAYGGGVYCNNGSPVITNNVFMGNEARLSSLGSGNGGGLYFTECNVELFNNAFLENYSGRHGGGMYAKVSSGFMTCNTFSHNKSGAGGAVYWREMTQTVTNSIFANNEAGNGEEMYLGDSSGYSHITLEYCDVLGGQDVIGMAYGSTLNWGAGMIDVDPVLAGDHHLSVSSPCIDAGDNSAAGVPSMDIDGDVRLFDGDHSGSAVVDMGCDEILSFLVPSGYPTIQSAIDAACSKGIVGVSPGTYQENLDFKGKAITVISAEGPDATWIDGGQVGRVVTFRSGEWLDSVLEGFTLVNGEGGIYCHDTFPTIQGNVIRNNWSPHSGGGVLTEQGSPLIQCNTIEGNEAIDGGGIACVTGSVVLRNNMIHGNTAKNGGGMFFGFGTIPVATNCTLYGNTATSVGGGIESFLTYPFITNTIVWGNSAPSGAQINAGSAEITYCDVQGGWPGNGNIDADPLFVDAGAGDLHLTSSSPCVDMGSNSAMGLPDEDFDGDDRQIYLFVDIGADEYALGRRELLVPSQFATIQAAIDAAQTGDTVLAAPGTYRENIEFKSKVIRVKSSGGSAVTAINGNQSGSVVQFVEGSGPGTVLEGFTLYNGSGTDHGFYTYGGAVFCHKASPTIMGNIIRDCSSENGGGGIYLYESGAVIEDNDIFHNSGSSGGGIYARESSDTLRGNRVFENTCEDHGGGIYCSGNQIVVDGNIITFNAGDEGGGIYCSKPVLGADPVMRNNVIAFNTAVLGGGAYVRRAIFTNNTVFGNSADLGGGCYVTFGNSYIYNSILWNNTAPYNGKEIYLHFETGFGSYLRVSYSDIDGGAASTYFESGTTLEFGPGMIETDPEFVDRNNGDFHLFYTSPCREGGVRNCPGYSDWDMEGDPRTIPIAPDMGADEFYTHLYYTGDAEPGGAIEVKLVGVPGTMPVGLFIGTGVLDPPVQTMWGTFYLAPPWVLFGPLGVLPAGGVMVLPVSLPLLPPAPYDVPLQALIGDELSNLCIIEVR